MEKYCKKCDTTKPVSEFHKNASRKDGLTLYCRQCNNRAGKEWMEKNPDYLKEWREKNPDYQNEWYENNKDAKKEYYKENRSVRKAYANNYHVENPGYNRMKKYNISHEEYLELLNAQGGVCAICGETNKSGWALSVDHNHDCCPGKESCGNCIRQLLCLHCNSMLGYARDNIETLKAAQNYLERHSKVKISAKTLDHQNF